MIPVILQPEPPDFDSKVRQPGRQWLLGKGIGLNSPPPKASDLPTYWRRTLKQLWSSYSGVCAYWSIFFEWPLQAASTDHFIAKSKNAGEAYEWSNFRLACLRANTKKKDYENILDPIGLRTDTFRLNFSDGSISPNQSYDALYKQETQKTIDYLDLDSPEMRLMRLGHFEEYRNSHIDSDYLKRKSPFVWYEAQRQGLL